jgi:hypothetical protein
VAGVAGRTVRAVRAAAWPGVAVDAEECGLGRDGAKGGWARWACGKAAWCVAARADHKGCAAVRAPVPFRPAGQAAAMQEGRPPTESCWAPLPHLIPLELFVCLAGPEEAARMARSQQAREPCVGAAGGRRAPLRGVILRRCNGEVVLAAAPALSVFFSDVGGGGKASVERAQQVLLRRQHAAPARRQRLQQHRRCQRL